MDVLSRSPWPTLTLIVSLEAIFLSTFVMIGQNRQSAFQQAEADHDYQDVNTLLVENTDITRVIDELTQDLHEHVIHNNGKRCGCRGDRVARLLPGSQVHRAGISTSVCTVW